MEITELLDQAKQRANLSSDYALAKVMGVPTGTVAHWRKGKRHPSNEEAVKLATLAGIEEMRVIAEIELRTANSEKKKEFWKSYLESRGIVATLGMIGLGLSIIITPEPASANVLQFANYDVVFSRENDNRNIHYAYYKQIPSTSNRMIIRAILNKLRALLLDMGTHNVVNAFR